MVSRRDQPQRSGDVGGPDRLAAAADAPLADVQALYDNWVGDYDADVGEWGYEAPAEVAARLAAVIPTGAVVLDAGCGTGLSGVALHDVGFTDTVGVDASPKSIEAAAERRVYLEVAVLDLAAPLPFADRHFGGVICCGVLSYLADVAAVLDEFVRVTAPGGAVVFTQRTDLWEPRSTQTAIDALVATGRCASAHVSEPTPYLPGHPDFTTDVGIRYVTLHVAEPST
jgi:predicted TPR repeat methyltransferase